MSVRSTSGERRAANVLLALGRRGSPRKLGVPGEEMPHVAYMLREPEAFAGQHVLVVGGGNSAVESALMLADAGCCASVGISYRKPRFARARGDNRKKIERYIESKRVYGHTPTEVHRIDETTVTLRECGDDTDRVVQCDAIIVQIGGTPPSELLQQIGIEIVTKYGER